MSDVPDEILREILSRLPVAPLLRFRCVSKSWKCLIEDQQFIKHHLNHSRKTNSNLNIILNSYCHVYSADFDLLNETNMAAFKQLSHPLETTYGETRILGSCDGLLVLRNDKDDVTILWNPWVRRFHEVPIEFPGDNTDSCHGFGYDVVSDDYKLIRIVRLKDNDEMNPKVKVYGLKSDSWRRIPDFPYSIDFIWMDGVLANGALHWIVSGKVKLDTDNLVAAFDLGTEEYRLMPLPEFAGGGSIHLDVAALGGCLSLIRCDYNEHRFDVWVMKEYGVQESWSILFRFDICDFDFTRPLAYSKCGRKVLLGLDYQVLTWYDLDKNSTDVPMAQMPSKDSILIMYTCLQSLVLLNNGTCDFVFVTKKNQERKDKKRSRRTRNHYLVKTAEIV